MFLNCLRDISVPLFVCVSGALLITKKDTIITFLKKRVNKAREIQNERYKGTGISCNARLGSAVIKKYCVLSPDAEFVLKDAFDELGMSARAYDRILKVSRTIADLEGKEIIDLFHVAQAIQFRSLDRKYWQREL